MLPTLYSFRRCPYAIRARVALLASHCRVEIREVVLARKPDSLLAYSAKGTVPVLVTNDGTVIDESLDIMQWTLTSRDPAGLLKTSARGQEQRTSNLLHQNDHSFKAWLDRYKYPNRFLGSTSPTNEDLDLFSRTARRNAETFLVELEQALSDHQFLLGETASLADIAIFPFIRQFAHVDKAWFDTAPYPALQRWLDNWLSSSLFHKAMVKYPPWQEGDAPTYFGGADE